MFDKPKPDERAQALLELIDLRVKRTTNWSAYNGVDNGKYSDAECARLAALVLKQR